MEKRTYRRFLIALIPLLIFTDIIIHRAKAEKRNAFPISPEASCITTSCHAGMAKKKYIHAVATDGSMCIICHEMPKEGVHTFKLKAEGGVLCAECHGDVADKKYKHFPVKEGMCIICHDPHQSDNPKQLVMPATSELCFMCHNTGEFEGATIHGPVLEGNCLNCHHPHTSDYPAQLKKAQPELCFGCHNTVLKDTKDIALPSIKDLYDDKNMKLHLPFAEGKCTTCHNQHVSKHYRLLNESYPESFYASFSRERYLLCFNCHSEKAFIEPRTLTDTAFRNGNLNLHYRHVNKKKGRTCRACHHNHGAENPHLIRKNVPFGSRYISINFEKTDTGGKCSSTCHGLVEYNRFEPVLNTLKVTPRLGTDATAEELQKSK